MPKKISRKQMEKLLAARPPRPPLCQMVMCHEKATIQIGDIWVCKKHEDQIPLLPLKE